MARDPIPPRIAAVAATVLLGWIVVACGLFPPAVSAPEECHWPPDTPLSFAGESSLGALGIGDAIIGPERDRLTIYVTPVPLDNGFREFCAVRQDGSLGGSVPDDWQPPLVP